MHVRFAAASSPTARRSVRNIDALSCVCGHGGSEASSPHAHVLISAASLHLAYLCLRTCACAPQHARARARARTHMHVAATTTTIRLPRVV
ncbi:hypothetical protein EON67_07940 [archaeon]|nr:MAG: hypothetical protein EON67_07940 [archaeon]